MDEGLIFEELHSEALPKGMRVWNALHGGYSWVIAYEPGLPDWSDSELANDPCGLATRRPTSAQATRHGRRS